MENQPFDIIFVQRDETDCVKTWSKTRLNNDDTMYIKAAIVDTEIRCIHNDMNGVEKSRFAVSVDGAKRLKRYFAE